MKNKVFKPSQTRTDVVLAGARSQSGETDFVYYAESFHEAGRTLLKPLLAAGRFDMFEPIPAVYLYRHALELYLKGIILSGNRLLKFEGEEIDENELKACLGSHRLPPLLPHVLKIFKAVGWQSPLDLPGIRTVEDLKDVLAEIDRVDAHSFAFRYPTNKKGERAVPDRFAFDLRVFVNIIDPLLDLLGGAVWGIEDAYSNSCDAYASMDQDYSY